MIELINGDCLVEMDKLIEKGVKVDAIICDPPYGTTRNKWDSIIPFNDYVEVMDNRHKIHIKYEDEIIYEEMKHGLSYEISKERFDRDKKHGMWYYLNKLIKPNGAIVLFGSEPFSSALRMSNIKNYKYDWVWEKSKPTGHLNAKKQPLRQTEMISVFYAKQCMYLPQGTLPTNKMVSRTNRGNYGECSKTTKQTVTNYPRNIIEFPSIDGVHQTQKPVALMEYLIKTYTNENETVLDFTMGSGSTMVACKNLNQNGIGIELDQTYFNITKERLAEKEIQLALF